MQPIQHLLNKIKWDKRETPQEYKFFYLDRIENKLKELKFDEIKNIEGSFIVLNNGNETNIPLHRVKKVVKNNIVIWERK